MKKPKNFEEAIAQLEEILNALSQQDTPLEESLKLYAQAAGLVELCEEKLRGASLQMEQIDQRLRQQGAAKEEDAL